MLLSWIAYAVVGRVLIYCWMQFPLPEFRGKFEKLNKLHTCSLCSGVWIYSMLAFFGMNIMGTLGFVNHIPFISEVVTGGITSFTVWMMEGGWHYYFDVIQIK